MSRSRSAMRSWCWRVREIIEEKGMSISEVARRAGVHPATVRAFCRNPQHETTTAMWGRLSEALGVSLDEMLDASTEVVKNAAHTGHTGHPE